MTTKESAAIPSPNVFDRADDLRKEWRETGTGLYAPQPVPGPILSDDINTPIFARLLCAVTENEPGSLAAFLGHIRKWHADNCSAALAAVPGKSEPVRYELRMRAPKGNCGPWAEVQGSVYERFRANPDIGDGFAYETRALYDHAAQPAPVSGSTSDEQKRAVSQCALKGAEGLGLCVGTCARSGRCIEREVVQTSKPLRAALDDLRVVLQMATPSIDQIHEFGPDGALEKAWQIFYDDVLPALAASPKLAAPAGAVVARPDLAGLRKFACNPRGAVGMHCVEGGQWLRFADVEALFAPRAPDTPVAAERPCAHPQCCRLAEPASMFCRDCSKIAAPLPAAPAPTEPNLNTANVESMLHRVADSLGIKATIHTEIGSGDLNRTPVYCPLPVAALPAELAGELPPLPELDSLADLAYAQNTPDDWDDDYRATWQKLQVAERNNMQWRVYALRLRAALAARQAPTGQPIIGKLLDEMSQIKMLWGLNEPGALVRFSDVSNVLFAASVAARQATDAQVSKMKWAAIEAHRICYETMLTHPEIAELSDDGVLHRAIHAVVGVETPNCSDKAPDTVRDAALEEAAALAVQWGNARVDDGGGHALRNCAIAIRALKSTAAIAQGSAS